MGSRRILIAPFCGRPDTMAHRIQGCCTKDIAALPEELQRDWLSLGSSAAISAAKLAGIGVRFDPPLPCNNGQWIFWSASEGITYPHDIDWRSIEIFTDGSCSKYVYKPMWRAGLAIVMWGPDNTLQAALYGPVWRGLPQTSASAEHCAIAVLGHIVGPQLQAAGDEATVYTDYKRGREGWGQSSFCFAALQSLWRIVSSHDQQLQAQTTEVEVVPQPLRGIRHSCRD